MSKPINMVGYTFNGCVVVSKSDEHSSKYICWNCLCKCGNSFVASGANIRKGHTKSCGCYQKERASQVKKTHGKTNTRMFSIWQKMRARCSNNKSKDFKNYGGRGIKVCESWETSFECFYEWSTNNGYTEKLTIDRIDVNGNYEPNNCRWVNRKIQNRNRTNNNIIEFRGEKLCLAEWSDKLGITYFTLSSRLKRGWSVERAFTTPVKKSRR